MLILVWSQKEFELNGVICLQKLLFVIVKLFFYIISERNCLYINKTMIYPILCACACVSSRNLSSES